MKIPCKDCILIPICRHKTFAMLMMECQLVKEYDDKHIQRSGNNYFVSVREIQDILNPTQWKYKKRKS